MHFTSFLATTQGPSTYRTRGGRTRHHKKTNKQKTPSTFIPSLTFRTKSTALCSLALGITQDRGSGLNAILKVSDQIWSTVVPSRPSSFLSPRGTTVTLPPPGRQSRWNIPSVHSIYKGPNIISAWSHNEITNGRTQQKRRPCHEKLSEAKNVRDPAGQEPSQGTVKAGHLFSLQNSFYLFFVSDT